MRVLILFVFFFASLSLNNAAAKFNGHLTLKVLKRWGFKKDRLLDMDLNSRGIKTFNPTVFSSFTILGLYVTIVSVELNSFKLFYLIITIINKFKLRKQ